MSAVRWQDIAALVLAHKDEFIAERDRRRFDAFIRRLFPGYIGGAHIDALVAALTWAASTPDARLIVTLPPRHGKSLHVSEYLPAWYLGRHPDRRVIGAAHTQDLADEFSRRVRAKLAHPDWPFPGVRIAGDASAVRRWSIDETTGSYFAVGVGGSPAGRGAELVIIDDPIKNAADAESPTVREAIWRWYREDIYTRLQPSGALIVCSTRWHHDDLTGRLLAAQEAGGEAWRHLHFPAIADDADGQSTALWPAYWSLEHLEQRRTVLGPRAFESLYQGRPSREAGGVLKRHWWRYWHPAGDPRPAVVARDERGDAVLCPCEPLPADFDAACQSWDMSFKLTESGSYVVGQVWWRVGADRYLLDQYRHRVDFPDAVLAVRALSAAHPRVATKLVENKANGPAVVSTLRRSVAGLVEVEPHGGKVARANAAAAVAASGNVYLPHPSIAPWIEAFVDECADFPYGEHDDQVDAFGQAQHHFGLGEATIGYSYLDAISGRNGHNGHNGHAEESFVDAVGNDLPRWRAPSGHGGRNGRW